MTANWRNMAGPYKSDLTMDEKVMMAILKAAEAFKKASSYFLKNYGLTFAQYNVLRVLDASGEGQLTMTAISNIMVVSGANLTGIAKRLEKKGFLIRKSDPKDERITLLEITPKGRLTLKNISEEKESNVLRFVSDLSEDVKLEFLSNIKKVLKKARA